MSEQIEEKENISKAQSKCVALIQSYCQDRRNLLTSIFAEVQRNTASMILRRDAEGII